MLDAPFFRPFVYACLLLALYACSIGFLPAIGDKQKLNYGFT